MNYVEATDGGILGSLGKFSRADEDIFANAVVERTFKREEWLLREGEVCSRIFYLTSGKIYQYLKRAEEETIIDLYVKKDWCLNHESFLRQRPSHSFIRAYSDSTVLELTVDAIHKLIAQSPAFYQLGSVLTQTVSRLQHFDSDHTTIDKLNHLQTNKPMLFQAFPLKMIASYLKVAPETLSRSRNY